MGRDDDGTGPPARRPARDEVERLLAERGEHLMRATIALTGSRSDGEDLLQGALERLRYRAAQLQPDLSTRPTRPRHPQPAAAPPPGPGQWNIDPVRTRLGMGHPGRMRPTRP